jgi:hypothetical protein
LARIKLIFDLLLGIALYLNGVPLPYLSVLVLDILLLLPYQRYVGRAPATLTVGTLAYSAGILALAPLGLGAAGVALWVLYPLMPVGAGFVLGRRRLIWQMTIITTVIAAAGAYPIFTTGEALVLDGSALLVLLLAIAGSIWATAWFTTRTLRPDPGSRDILGHGLTVVRGVVIVPFNWVVGGVRGDSLKLELHDLKRRHNPSWIVLDLSPAGELGRHDLSAINRAAASASTAHCTVVLARPSVDALGHLDFAQSAIGRVERFATVPQAVEAGLRRLGWAKDANQSQRIVTTLSG